jgi:hypothetical protein
MYILPVDLWADTNQQYKYSHLRPYLLVPGELDKIVYDGQIDNNHLMKLGPSHHNNTVFCIHTITAYIIQSWTMQCMSGIQNTVWDEVTAQDNPFVVSLLSSDSDSNIFKGTRDVRNQNLAAIIKQGRSKKTFRWTRSIEGKYPPPTLISRSAALDV